MSKFLDELNSSLGDFDQPDTVLQTLNRPDRRSMEEVATIDRTAAALGVPYGVAEAGGSSTYNEAQAQRLNQNPAAAGWVAEDPNNISFLEKDEDALLKAAENAQAMGALDDDDDTIPTLMEQTADRRANFDTGSRAWRRGTLQMEISDLGLKWDEAYKAGDTDLADDIERQILVKQEEMRGLQRSTDASGAQAIEQLPRMFSKDLPTTLGVALPIALLTGGTGAIAAAGIGSFLASQESERGAYIAEHLADKDDLGQPLDRDEMLRDAWVYGTLSGGVEGFFDSVTAGIGGKLMKPFLKAFKANPQRVIKTAMRDKQFSSIMREILFGAAGVAGSEAGEEGSQQAIQKAVEGWGRSNATDSGTNYYRQPSDFWSMDTLREVGEAALAGGQTGLWLWLMPGALHAVSRISQVQNAQQFAEANKQFAADLATSQTKEMAPQRLDGYLMQMPAMQQDVLVPADAVLALDTEQGTHIAEQLGWDEKSLREAAEMGQEVSFKLSYLQSHLDKDSMVQMSDIMRRDANAASAVQAADLNENIAADMAAAVDAAEDISIENAAIRGELQRLERELLDTAHAAPQLMSQLTGKSSPDDNPRAHVDAILHLLKAFSYGLQSVDGGRSASDFLSGITYQYGGDRAPLTPKQQEELDRLAAEDEAVRPILEAVYGKLDAKDIQTVWTELVGKMEEGDRKKAPTSLAQNLVERLGKSVLAKSGEGVTLKELTEELVKSGVLPEGSTTADLIGKLRTARRPSREDRINLTTQAGQQQVLNQFLGEQGAARLDAFEEATTRMDDLATARQMEAGGKDALTIKMATGWERGADGLWRYEIPDFKLKPLTNHRKTTLAKVIDDEALMAAYPELGKIALSFQHHPMSKGANGTFDRAANTIYLPSASVSTLRHEVQHAIQEIEGFAGGGSWRQMWQRAPEQTRKIYEGFRNPATLEEYAKNAWQTEPDGITDEIRAAYDKYVHELETAWKERNSEFQEGAAYVSYKRLAGEVEARNVQARAGMTFDERRTTLAEATEDVARKDQIILRTGLLGEYAEPLRTPDTASDDQSGPRPDADVVGGPELYQVQNLPSWKDHIREWCKDHGFSEERTEAFIGAIEGQMAIFWSLETKDHKTAASILENFVKGATKEEDEKIEHTKDTNFPFSGPIRSNADPIYILSFDASTMCVKRLGTAATTDLVEKTLGRPLEVIEQMALVEAFRDAGLEAPCLYCYVESNRMRTRSAVRRAVAAIEAGAKPANWKRAKRVDLITKAITESKEKGMTTGDIPFEYFLNPNKRDKDFAIKWKAEHPAISACLVFEINNVKANKPKLYEEYRGEILNLTPEQVKTLNGFAGLRYFSSSDFQIEHVCDLMQAFWDMKLVGAKSHAYTKVPLYAKIFGKTGQKINLSCFAKVTKDGKIIADTHQGWDWEAAKKAREEGGDDVGIMMMAASDEILDWALKQDWIDYIIPFHNSGLEKAYYERMGWQDFSRTQSESFIYVPKREKRISAAEIEELKKLPPAEASIEYARICFERGYLPKGYDKLFKDEDILSLGLQGRRNRAKEIWAEMWNAKKFDASRINPEFFEYRLTFASNDEAYGKPEVQPIRMYEMGTEKGITDREGAEIYLRLCLERRLNPVFPSFCFKKILKEVGEGENMQLMEVPFEVAKGETLEEKKEARKNQTKDAKAFWKMVYENKYGLKDKIFGSPEGFEEWIRPELFRFKKDYARTDTPFRDIDPEAIDLEAIKEPLMEILEQGVDERYKANPQIAQFMLDFINEGDTAVTRQTLESLRTGKPLLAPMTESEPELYQMTPEEDGTAAIRAQYEGTDQWMKAPNGEDTNLTEQQWLQVRTPEFKAWFGDWENDPENSSKVVDENGEPKIVYHGTNVYGLKKFKKGKKGYLGGAIYTTDDRSYAARYTDYGTVMELYGNIRRPLYVESVDAAKEILSAIYGDKAEKEYAKRMAKDDDEMSLVKNSDIKKLGELGYDGVIWRAAGENEFAMYTPTQLKSATDNRGGFDSADPRIYYQTAWHGSPAKFDSFSTSHIGEGEGAQAHGWGLYFAGNKDVSEEYRERLTGKTGTLYIVGDEQHARLEDFTEDWLRLPEVELLFDGKMTRDEVLREWTATYEAMQEVHEEDRDEALQLAVDEEIGYLMEGEDFDETAFRERWLADYEEEYQSDPERQALDEGIRFLSNPENVLEKGKGQDIPGQLFEVDIPENDVLLDEQKEFLEQPEKVQQAVRNLLGDGTDQRHDLLQEIKERGGEKAQALAQKMLAKESERKSAENWNVLQGMVGDDVDLDRIHDILWEESRWGDGKNIYAGLVSLYGSPRAASEALNSQGVKGITYFGGTDGRCFVVFDDKAIRIMDTYYQAQQRDAQLRQQVKRGALGSMKPGGDGSYTVNLFQSANLSTLLHETSHVFFMEMERLERHGQASQRILDDLDKLRKWTAYMDDDAHLEEEYNRTVRPLPPYSGRSLAELTPQEREDVRERAKQEMMARGFEQYVREGKAPSAGLRGVFQRFKRWLLRVYISATQLHVEITDEVRGVFDRMLATDVEMQSAAEGLGIRDETRQVLDALGLKGADRLRIEGMIADAVSGAADSLRHARDKDRQKRVRKWSREAAAEAREERVYKTIEVLKASKLNTGDLVDSYGEDELKALTSKYKNLTDDNGTANAEVVAAQMGYASGLEMLRDIVAAPTFQQRKQELVGQKEADHDALYDADKVLFEQDDLGGQQELISQQLAKKLDEIIDKAATDAGHADKARRAMQGLRRYRVGKQQLEDEARKYLSRMTVQESSAPEKFRGAAAKWAAEERKAILKKDWEAALSANYKTRISIELARQAAKNRDTFTSLQKHVDSFLRRKTKGTDAANARYAVYLLNSKVQVVENPTRQMRANAGLSDAGEDTGDKSYQENVKDGFFKSMQSSGFMSGEDVAYAEPLFGKDVPVRKWWSMPLADFLPFAEVMAQIVKIEKDSRKIRTAQGMQDFEEYTSDLATIILAHNKHREPGSLAEVNKLAQALKKVKASLLKADTILALMDDDETMGPLWRAIMEPMNKATWWRADRLKKERDALDKLFSVYSEKERIDMRSKRYTVAGVPDAITKEQALCILLNWGTESNRDRVLDQGVTFQSGDGQISITGDQVQAIIDSLDQKDVDFAQAVWDYFETFRKESFDLEERLTGVRPIAVEAVPVQTRYGELRGGYYPIRYDPTKSSAVIDMEKLGTQTGGAGTPYVESGSMKSRKVVGLHAPLDMHINVIPNHVAQTVQMLAFREPVREVARILNSAKVNGAIQSTDGVIIADTLKDWLRYIAGERPAQNIGDKALSALRKSVAIFTMGFKYTTMIAQITGGLMTREEIGTKFTAIGGLKVMHNPLAAYQFACDMSAMMRNRITSIDRDIFEVSSALVDLGAEKRRDRWWKKLQSIQEKYAYIPMGYVAMFTVDLPTWHGAYSKAVAEGRSVQDAVQYADLIVERTQSGGAEKDLAGVQRSKGLMQLATVFYGYFSAVCSIYIRRMTMLKRHPSAVNAFKLATLYLSIGLVEPVLSGLLTGHGPDEDEPDAEDWALWIGAEAIKAPFQSVPILRDMVGVAVDHMMGQKTFGYKASPIFTVPESFVKTVMAWTDLIMGEGEVKDVAFKTLDTVGRSTGIVNAQELIILENVVNWLDGTNVDWELADFIRKDRGK